ncbi:pilus assembly protein PilM [Omnitrophica bacterium]|nr:pilus assembly protein PilM [Candidatus Omnitrophota bacterium]
MAFKKKESISVFDIEDGRIKLAQFNIDDTRKALYRLVAIKTRDTSPTGLAKVIRKIVSDYKLGGTRAIINIQRYKVTVKNLKLPSTNPSEIENMVSLQASKQLPFSPEDIISTYRILGRDPKGYSDVMMALVHRDVIDKVLEVFGQAGLDVERLALGSEALSLWYIGRQREDEKKSCVCLVDIGTSHLEIQIIREGALDFTRSINFSSPEDMGDRMLEEIRKSLFTFRKASSGKRVDKLVLTGRRSVINREAPKLKQTLGLPMVYVDAVRQWPKSEDAVLPAAEEFSRESFTTVAALGFNHDKLQTNFMPQEIRLRRISKVAKESLVISATLFLCVLLGVVGITAKNFIDKKRYLASINTRLKEAQPRVKRLTRLKKATDVIKKQLNFKGSGLDVLRELYNNIPTEIALAIFDYEDSRSCLLRGTSQRLSDVFKFISILEDSAYFENVKVRYATKRVIGKKELTDFEIICQLTAVGTK